MKFQKSAEIRSRTACGANPKAIKNTAIKAVIVPSTKGKPIELGLDTGGLGVV